MRPSNRRARSLNVEHLEARQLLAADPIINEFLANNQNGLVDGFGNSEDWIEIFNRGDEVADLSGFRLTDDASDLTKWAFPANTTLASGAYMVVFASGLNLTTPDSSGYLHTNFRMNADGEYLALTSAGPTPSVLSEFGPAGTNFPDQEPDISYGIGPDAIPETFLGPQHPLQVLAPATSGLGQTWTQIAFNDSAWQSGESGVGFDTSSPLSQETVGNPLEERDMTGSSQGSIWVMTSTPFLNAGNVSQWSMYSTAFGREITPLILRQASPGNYEFVGIGQTRISDGSGTQTFSFALEEGSAQVEPGDFFAWKDGDQNSNNGYTVAYDEFTDETVDWLGGNQSIFLGRIASAQQGPLSREYSVQAEVDIRPYDEQILTEIPTSTDSAYVRSKFNVNLANPIDTLTLNLQYDDGVVAYLNGVEVFRNLAPANPTFNSTATGSRTDAESLTPQSIDITGFKNNLVNGENVLAIQLLNFAGDDDMLLAATIETGISSSAAGTVRYFDTPTPEEANNEGFIDFVRDTTFSVDRGFYSNAFNVDVASATPGATLVYTTDGSEPTLANGTQVFLGAGVAPAVNLPVTTTTTLRAAAFLNNFLPTNVDTQTYIFVDDVVENTNWFTTVTNNPLWDSLLDDSLLAAPTISIVTGDSQFSSLQSGPGNAVQVDVPASIELIYPDGSTGFQVNAGVEHFGGDSLASPKKNTRISFKSEFGPSKLNYDLFNDPTATTEFDQLILHSGSHDSWLWHHATYAGSAAPDGVFFRNRWAQDRQLELGHVAPHGQFVQVYINGGYAGLHSLAERPKAGFLASYFGGSKEDYDAFNSGSVIDGNSSLYNQMLSAVSSQDWPLIQQLMDVDNYIDYMLLEFYGGNNWDWNANQNWYAATGKNGETDGFQFYSWDSDIKLREDFFENNVNRGGPENMWGSMRNIPEFKLKLADRVQELFYNDGVFTTARVQSQIDALAAEVEPLVIAEAARWGNVGHPERDPGRPGTGNSNYTPATWQNAVDQIKNNFVASRTNIVLGQLSSVLPSISAPSFLVDGVPQHGGSVSVGAELSIDADSGSIYYTTDGSDPRAANGQPVGIPFDAQNPIDLNSLTNVRARLLSGGEWSALSQATFITGQPADPSFLRISEINYNPHDPITSAELAIPGIDNDDFEFIEIINSHPTDTLNLSGIQLTGEVSFGFGNDFLLPGERAVVVEDTTAFEARYGNSVNVLGQWGGKLDNGGAELSLLDNLSAEILTVAYNDSDPWSISADGDGATLVLDDTANTPADEAGKYYRWRTGAEFGGTPGAASTPLAGIVINEVLARPDGSPALDTIELYNPTAQLIDISGWYLSNAGNDLLKFEIPDSTELGANSYITFDEDDFNVGANAFTLDGLAGDQVYLVTSDGMGAVNTFVDQVDFDGTLEGQSLGRSANGIGRLAPMQANTFGSANSAPAIGSVIISEVNYHPENPSAAALAIDPALIDNDLEFIEIYNTSSTTEDLTNWQIRGQSDLDFAVGTMLSGQSALVVVTFDPTVNTTRANAFRTHYGIGAGVTLVGGLDSKLSNGYGRVELERADALSQGVVPRVTEDEVLYDDHTPWATTPDGGGESLNRTAVNAYGNSALSWSSATPTPGSVTLATPSADFDNDNDVDGNDFLIWQRGFGKVLTAAPEDGDADLDGSVNGSDLGVWQAQFGSQMAPVASFSSISTAEFSSSTTPTSVEELLDGPVGFLSLVFTPQESALTARIPGNGNRVLASSLSLLDEALADRDKAFAQRTEAYVRQTYDYHLVGITQPSLTESDSAIDRLYGNQVELNAALSGLEELEETLAASTTKWNSF